MYESHFQFLRRPFAATPDAECVFLTDAIRETLAEFVICTERGQGISVLTGAAGMGKTLLCGRLADELSGQFQVALLKNANFATRRSLLQSLMFELGQKYSEMSEQELRLELERYGESVLQDRQGIALIIDEAHLMSQRLLEEVRGITNLTLGGTPLIRVVLSGQPLLEETLAQPGMAAVNQRIASQHHLEPLTRSESQQYIEYRINWAGANPQQVFTDEAIAAIAHAADGVPRALNQLCDHTLLLAFVSDCECADAAMVDEALEDLRQLPLHWNERTRIAGPLDALTKTATETTIAVDAEACEEPFDFDAFSTEGMETIEIGGSQEDFVEDSAAEYEEIGTEEYALAAGGKESAADATNEEPAAVLELPASDHDVEEEEKLMENDAVQVAHLSLHTESVAGVVPLLDESRPGEAVFEEEYVVDRYSSLEAERRERAPLSANISAVEQPQPEIVETLPAAEELAVAEPTAAVIEEPVVEIAEIAAEIPTEVSNDVEEPSDDVIGAAILNDRLKAHRNVIDQINQLNFGEVDDNVVSELEAGFDVVELEPSEPTKTLRHDRQPAPAAQSSTEESESGVVPQPNLRRLFTKLRRVQYERNGR